MKSIYERIIGDKDPDRPCGEEQMKENFDQYLDWEQFKVKTVEEIYNLQRIENKGVNK